MDKPRLGEILQEKIKIHLAENGVRLEQLSKASSVPLVELRLLVSGQARSTSIGVARAILNQICPEEVQDILKKYFEATVSQLETRFTASGRNLDFNDDDAFEGDNQRAKVIFKSVSHYRLFGWILAGMDRATIQQDFGAEGLRLLSDFVESNVVELNAVGEIAVVTERISVLNFNDIKRQSWLNAESIDLTAESWVSNEMVNLNQESIAKVRSILKEAVRQAYEVVADDNNSGDQPIVFSLLFSPLPKKMAPNFSEQQQIPVAGLAHDMRSPLRFVLRYLDDLSQVDSGVKLKRVRAAAVRVNHMVDMLRKLESGEIVSRQMDHLNMESVLLLAESLMEDYSIGFTVSGENHIEGYFDIEKVDRAIQNLLTNAFEAAHNFVHLEWFPDGDAWVVRVTDDGPGVAEADVPRIFERGFTFGKSKGTGIGLANVKRMAEGHDGTIQYERIGHRTVFTLLLRHVFSPDLIHEKKSKPAQTAEKPILYVEVTDLDLQEDLLLGIANTIPEYRITSDRSLLPQALLACTDSLETALHASDLGVQRIWNPSLDMIRNLRFAEALKNLATLELEAMRVN